MSVGYLPVCGIAGILRRDGGPIPPHWIRSLDAAIARRGRNEGGRFHDTIDTGSGTVEVLLLHRQQRTGERREEPQPTTATDQSGDIAAAIVFDGHLANADSLLKEYLRWGEHVGDQVDGMYAAAIWNRNTASLSFLRDIHGQKPLHVLDLDTAGEGLVFCSSAPPLLAIARELDLYDPPSVTALQRYLQLGYLTDHPTLIRPIASVPRYSPTDHATREPVEDAMTQGVTECLHDSTPNCCLLSGGMDSSLVAAIAKKENGDLQTIHVRMDDPQRDESHTAQAVADHLGTRHVTLDIEPHPADDLRDLVSMLGKPFADSSVLATYWICRAAGKATRFALSGIGGKEVFFGHERYRRAAVMARWHGLLATVLGRKAPGSWSRATDWSTLGVAALSSIFDNAEIKSMTAADFLDPVLPHPHEHPTIQAQRFDMEHLLPGAALPHIDACAAAAELDIRSPFLLLRLRQSLAESRMPPKDRRKLLRDMAQRFLPATLLDRPNVNTALPVSAWFRSDHGGLGQLLGDELTSPDAFGDMQINTETVLRLLDEHRRGDRDHGDRLFALLTLAMWQRQASSQ
jgi:asparagine synthase (glutamine-hydrolysing)